MLLAFIVESVNVAFAYPKLEALMKRMIDRINNEVICKGREYCLFYVMERASHALPLEATTIVATGEFSVSSTHFRAFASGNNTWPTKLEIRKRGL